MILVLLVMAGCDSIVPSDGSAQVNLTLLTPQENTDSTSLPSGTYDFSLDGAYTLAGAYDGLELNFSMPYEPAGGTLYFMVHLPSTNSFQLSEFYGHDEEGSGIFTMIAFLETTPLTLTPDDYTDLVDAFEYPLRPQITIEHWHPVASGQSDVEYVHFPSFAFTIESLTVKDSLLSMTATFEGEIEADYAATYGLPMYSMEGSIDLSNVSLGLIEID